jgi:hypothetical protein
VRPSIPDQRSTSEADWRIADRMSLFVEGIEAPEDDPGEDHGGLVPAR